VILRDPVHGLIPFDTEEDQIVVRLLGAAEVQRLRRIRQLGVTSLAFPGAEHSRFVHAIGTAHVMKRLIERLRRVQGDLPAWQRLTTEHAREALAAALLHDVGHGPLSHLFEDAIAGALPH
jgi:HD superfamily phosphohydrolase